MANTIQIKRSSTATSVPTSGQLAVGELAVNLADKKLYTKDASDAVINLTPEVTDKIQPVSASVAPNALTVTLNPTTLDFRSSTLNSGTVNTRTVATAISAVVPSGATLGTVDAVLSRVLLIAIDNAGTVELAVCNGSLSLDESGLINTTALSAAADSASVIYSTTARTNVPFRIVGFVESTQATAGTWATAPSKIQGAGGNVLSSSVSSTGTLRAWVNFNGTTTPPTIRASGNVSSVTKNGTGDYTVNFTTAMPDENYVMSGFTTGIGETGNVQAGLIQMRGSTSSGATAKNTTSCRIYASASYTGIPTDYAEIHIQSFR